MPYTLSRHARVHPCIAPHFASMQNEGLERVQGTAHSEQFYGAELSQLSVELRWVYCHVP